MIYDASCSLNIWVALLQRLTLEKSQLGNQFFISSQHFDILSSRTLIAKSHTQSHELEMSEKTASIFPVRWAVAILAFVGFIFNYMLRVNINITIVSMVNFTGKLKSYLNFFYIYQFSSLLLQSFDSIWFQRYSIRQRMLIWRCRCWGQLGR